MFRMQDFITYFIFIIVIIIIIIVIMERRKGRYLALSPFLTTNRPTIILDKILSCNPLQDDNDLALSKSKLSG